jgi:redox-sensitive bicupin YhaK (pirin superfamily)
MLTVKKSNQRGRGDHGWLKSNFSFSFADYYDPAAMGFRALRVINEDHIAPGGGFPPHPHRDMEIITYVVAGELQHKDSHGFSEVIRPGEVQRMSAGSGVTHSEFNPSRENAIHLLQIWIQPNKGGGKYGYDQKSFDEALTSASGGKVLAISENGRDGSISIQQDAELYVARPRVGGKISHEVHLGRHVWLQTVKGALTVNGETLSAGDAIFGADEKLLEISAAADSEFLLFDLA